MKIDLEKIILKKETYDKLMFKASFYDSYVEGKLAFVEERKQQEVMQLWTKENAFIEIEDYYKALFEDYKKRVRRRFTLKFWKWSIKLSRKQ